MAADPKEAVLAFWAAMGSNDFHKASELLTEDFRGFWPQSGELIEGRRNFAEINTSYPANGLWRFRIDRAVAQGDQVVTDVEVTDGTLVARAVTFHTVRDGLIASQVEYWPDDFEAPEWRAKWVRVAN